VGGAALVYFGLLLLALVLFAMAEYLEAAPGELPGPFAWLVRLDSDAAMASVGNAAQVVAGVLAIAITVVAIVVELAANRYTHRITQLFVREPVNLLVMSFFVLTTVLCVWVSTTPGTLDVTTARVPHAGLILTMAMVTSSLLVLLPYFAFVFRFLTPNQVVQGIERQAVRSIARATREMRPGMRAAAIEAIEELEDIARGARQHSDRSIAMAAIEALRQLLEDYEPMREQLPARWFDVDGPLLRDPDFVSMDRSVVADLAAERMWFETKILRQYHSIFTESLVVARDLANLIALNTRRIGASAAHEHPALLRVVVRFFNSYLRAAINARDLRTAYYVLQQYRLMCEAVMEAGRADVAFEIVNHFRYYGQHAFTQGQGFLLEVVAYDVAQIVEFAVESGHEGAAAMVDLFLEIDRAEHGADQEERLRGIRRCQVQLATFFLERGDEVTARRIFADMENERSERLIAVRDELLAEGRPQYWEFTDRGVNFSYLPPKRRAFVEPFFAWFGSRLTRP
jgi:hypothetical protein